MKILVALIYLSGTPGVTEYRCHDRPFSWYAQDELGIAMQGRYLSLEYPKVIDFKTKFLDKVVSRYQEHTVYEICDGKHEHG